MLKEVKTINKIPKKKVNINVKVSNNNKIEYTSMSATDKIKLISKPVLDKNIFVKSEQKQEFSKDTTNDVKQQFNTIQNVKQKPKEKAKIDKNLFIKK